MFSLKNNTTFKTCFQQIIDYFPSWNLNTWWDQYFKHVVYIFFIHSFIWGQTRFFWTTLNCVNLYENFSKSILTHLSFCFQSPYHLYVGGGSLLPKVSENKCYIRDLTINNKIRKSYDVAKDSCRFIEYS